MMVGYKEDEKKLLLSCFQCFAFDWMNEWEDKQTNTRVVDNKVSMYAFIYLFDSVFWCRLGSL